MESSSERLLVHEKTRRLSTDGGARKKRSSPSPLLYDEPKKRRMDDNVETSSRESRWSQYRDCLTLSTLTEASDSHDNNPDTVLEGCNVHVAAHQVPDLEEHIDKLAMELEEWSLVNLKEWRQKKACENLMEVDAAESSQRPNAVKAARQRQKAAKRKLMRALRHIETIQNETMQDT